MNSSLHDAPAHTPWCTAESPSLPPPQQWVQLLLQFHNIQSWFSVHSDGSRDAQPAHSSCLSMHWVSSAAAKEQPSGGQSRRKRPGGAREVRMYGTDMGHGWRQASNVRLTVLVRALVDPLCCHPLLPPDRRQPSMCSQLGAREKARQGHPARIKG